MSFSGRYLALVRAIAEGLDPQVLERAVLQLAALRARGGRLFVLGVGGSAATASHAVNDFRKLCGIEAYAPTDNVAELTARTNDEGWATTYRAWLGTSRLSERDAVLVLSVGGGDLDACVSPNLVEALRLAEERRTPILGIVGRDGGYTLRVADPCILIPSPEAALVTPLTEAFHSVVLHSLVSHPSLKQHPTKW